MVAAPTSEKVTFAADAFFDVAKWNLKPEGKAKLDDLAAKVKALATATADTKGHAAEDETLVAAGVDDNRLEFVARLPLDYPRMPMWADRQAGAPKRSEAARMSATM